MKKSLKLLSIGAAAAVWMGLAGTMFVYVVSDQGLFSAHKPGTGEAILLTDEDLQDRINELISGGLYDPEGDIIGDITSSVADYPAGMGSVTVAGGMADRLKAGADAGHSLQLSDGAEQAAATIKTGTLEKTCDVLRFSRNGARAEWIMDLSKPVPENGTEPVLLEIEEIHEASTQAFGYTVYVNDEAVYFRTYEQIASAPNHYFIAVDRSRIADLSAVKVALVSASDRPFQIANVYAYTNFSELMASEEVYEKMGIYFYSAADPDQGLSTIASFPKDYTMFDTGLMLSLKYMNLNRDTAQNTLREYINAAAQAGVPLQIMSAMYWSNSPYSPDGLGGSFSDLKYSQILYNSVLDQYMASTPNVYSSTQWVTTGSGTLNTAAVSKLRSYFSDFSRMLSFMRGRGLNLPSLDLVMEWGVCYKGVGTLNGYEQFGALDGADYHPGLVAAAAADGVKLDPKDGLSYAEKYWLMQWHAAYNQLLADAYREAIGNDAVQVNNGTVTMPATQTIDHIFSHNVEWINQNPSYDLTISGWQSGVGDGFYSSSEDMFFDPLRFYQYKASFGRTGCVNLEMAIHNPKGVLQKYIQKAYLSGMEFVTLFNDKSEYGTAENIREIDGAENTPAPAPEHFDVNILDIDYTRDVAKNLLKNPPDGVSYENLAAKDGYLYLSDRSRPGVITLKLTDGGRSFDTGLYLDLSAILSSSDTVELYGGTSAGNLQKLSAGDLQITNDRFNQNELYRYDFTKASKGQSTYYVQVRITSGGGNPTLRSLKVYRPFGETAGQLNGMGFTYKEARLHSLWVSARAVAENAYADYVEKNGGSDKIADLGLALLDAGYYKTAYRLLAGEISQVLPAKYLVTGSGALGKYPIDLSLAKEKDSVQITLTEIGQEKCAFAFDTEKDQQVTLTFAGLNAKKKYRLVDEGDNRFSLTADGSGDLTAKDGRLTVTVSVKTPGAQKLTTVTGRLYSTGGSTINVTVQDPAIANYSQYETYMISSECVYTRRADGASEAKAGSPKTGDMVTLTFNENNMVVKCEAVYGEKTAAIKAFIPPSLGEENCTNGVIEFTDGTRFELENQATTTAIRLGGLDTRARQKTPEQLAALLTPGTRIRITYCPERYNGALPRVLSINDP